MILPCDCWSEYQDRKYGLGNRIHNQSGTKPSANCTVCGKAKNTSAGDIPKSKDKKGKKK